MKTRFVQSAGVALLAAAALVLSGCAAEPTEESGNGSTPETTEAAPVTQAECEGVWTVAEFGDLEAENVSTCVDTDEAITASEAFVSAGIELSESTAFAGAICRVDGQPAADVELEYEGETHVEDCENMGPMWAYWGLFVDTGAGWEYAMEGAATQEVEPGQAVAFVWQFGDTTEPTLPAA